MSGVLLAASLISPPVRERDDQVVLLASILALSWPVMMIVHAAGLVLLAWACGETIYQVVLVLQRQVFPQAQRGSLVSLMPNPRNFFRVAFVWPLRAAAFLFCVRSISAAVRSNSSSEGHWPSHQDGIMAATAVCT